MSKEDFKIKYQKLKIHFIYCSSILIGLAISLFAVRNYSNDVMVDQFALGATLIGIILSVLAIILTLIGETKVSNTKDNLVEVSEELKKITDTLDTSMNNLSELTEIKLGISNIVQGNNEIKSHLSDKILEPIGGNISKSNNIDYIALLDQNLYGVVEPIMTAAIYLYIELKRLNIPCESMDKLAHFISEALHLDDKDSLFTTGAIVTFLKACKDEEFIEKINSKMHKNQNRNSIDNYLSTC